MAIKGIRQAPPEAELSLIRAAGGLQSLPEGDWMWVAWGS